MWASWRGHLDVVNHLLQCNANANAISKVIIMMLHAYSVRGVCNSPNIVDNADTSWMTLVRLTCTEQKNVESSYINQRVVGTSYAGHMTLKQYALLMCRSSHT